jgi:uncharacterized protein
MNIDERADGLQRRIQQIGAAAVCYSGGVDSGLLLTAAARAIGRDAVAVTVNTPYFATRDLELVKSFSARIDVRHVILDMEMPAALENNPPQRCYYCKKEMLAQVRRWAKQENISAVLDGSNSDDMASDRPGLRALREMGIVSPLAELGFSKPDVRTLAKLWGLKVWDRPSDSCLLTRIPANTRVERATLRRIEDAEELLHEEGFSQVRVRVHGPLARLELSYAEQAGLWGEGQMQRIDTGLRRLGFRYVTVDLAGYRSGSMSEAEGNG